MLGKGRRGGTQARGRARRQLLLEAARRLLETRDVDEITLPEVAVAAGIPKSSTYHFFDDLHALYAELASVHDEELYQAFSAPMPQVSSWQDIVREFARRAGGYFSENVSAQKLMFGPKTPPDIKRASRGADVRHGELLESSIDAVFVLPDLPQRSRIFFRAVEAMDLMFGLSLIEYDALVDPMVREAHRIAVAYLELYVPPKLERRGGA